jgi:polyketide cyclase/dehydrase/lipid transport protein
VTSIEARRDVAASPHDVFEFLSDLRNHWRLEPHFVVLEGLDMDAQGGHVRMRGPLGLSRVAKTAVLQAEAPDGARPGALSGRADVGRTTVGRVSWRIEPNGDGSHVVLSATVERASLADRVMLLAGGRWWLRRIFVAALSRLESEVAAR